MPFSCSSRRCHFGSRYGSSVSREGSALWTSQSTNATAARGSARSGLARSIVLVMTRTPLSCGRLLLRARELQEAHDRAVPAGDHRRRRLPGPDEEAGALAVLLAPGRDAAREHDDVGGAAIGQLRGIGDRRVRRGPQLVRTDAIALLEERPHARRALARDLGLRDEVPAGGGLLLLLRPGHVMRPERVRLLAQREEREALVARDDRTVGRVSVRVVEHARRERLLHEPPGASDAHLELVDAVEVRLDAVARSALDEESVRPGRLVLAAEVVAGVAAVELRRDLPRLRLGRRARVHPTFPSARSLRDLDDQIVVLDEDLER